MKKKFLPLSIFIFLSLFSLFFFVSKNSLSKQKAKRTRGGSSDKVLAFVNNKAITLKEFQEKYDLVREKAFQIPSPKEFLEDLVRYEIGVQEAKKTNIRKLPEVQNRFNQEMYKVFVERSIGSQVQKIKITPEEMRRFYNRNPVVHTRHILIEVPPHPTQKQLKENKTRAKQICEKIKKNRKNFQEAARLYSDDPLSKTSGGDLGYRSRLTFSHLPNYYKTALKMKNGDIQCMVRTKSGFHIIQRVGLLPYSKSNKNQIKASVFDEKRVKIFHDFFNQLKKKHKIRKNLALLKKVK